MPKKEEKKKEEEKIQNTQEAEVKSESEDQVPKEAADEAKPISELTEQASPKTIADDKVGEPEGITMEPISAEGPPEVQTPTSEPATNTQSAPSDTLPIDQIGEPKPTQETYPLADEIEKDATKKKSFLSSLLIFRNKKGKIILLILAVILIIGLAIGTIMNTNNEKLSFMKLNTKTRETVVLSPTQAPSPTPTTTAIDKTSLTIQVQNGSGESGVAGVMKDLLIENGYEGTIDTGNADNYDYTETIVKVKSTKASIEEELRTELSKNYTVSEEKEELEESSEYDIVIIVGSE